MTTITAPCPTCGKHQECHCASYMDCVCLLLSSGGHTLIDTTMYQMAIGFKWTLDRIYAKGSKWKYKPYLHRLVMKAPKGVQVDHINGDGLDNRKQNLRLCTAAENGRNSRKQKGTSSRYKGVCRHQNGWKVQARFNRKRIHIGCFKQEEDAATAYNLFAAINYGEFATFNKSDGERRR